MSTRVSREFWRLPWGTLLALMACLPAVCAQDEPPAPPAAASEDPPTEDSRQEPDPTKNGDASKEGEDPPAAAKPDSAEACYADGASFQNNGAYDLAIEQWKKFLEQYPEDGHVIEAHYNLGTCLLQLQRFPEAIESLQRALAAQPDEQHPFARKEDGLLNLGWAQYSLALQGKTELFAQAEETFQRLRDEFPQGDYLDQACFYQGESRYLQGKREEAAEAYRTVVEKLTDSKLLPDALYAWSVTQEELRQFELAAKLYGNFLEKYGDHPLAPEVGMRRAEALMQQGSLDEAEKGFTAAAQLKGFAMADHALFRLGICRLQRQAFGDAAAIFERIVREFPQSGYVPDAILATAQNYYRAGNGDKAQAWYDKARGLEGDRGAEATHWQNRRHLEKKEYAQALKLATEAIERFKSSQLLVHLRLDQADAWFELPEHRAEGLAAYDTIAREFAEHPLAAQAQYNGAHGCLREQQHEEALRRADEFLARYADHPLANEAKGIAAECKLRMGQVADAESIYKDLANEGTQDPYWHVRQGLALLLQEKHDAAIASITPVLDKLANEEQRAEAHHVLGLCHLAGNDISTGIQELKQALEVAPRWRKADESLLELAQAYRRANQLDLAEATITSLIQDFPNCQQLDRAHYRRGEYRYTAKKYQDALRDYAEVRSKWPDSTMVPHCMYGEGWTWLRQQEYPKAIQSLSDLITSYPEHRLVPRAHHARAMCRQRTSEFAEAKEDIAQFLKSGPTPEETAEALYVQGLCDVGLGDQPAAISVWTRLIQDHPNYPSIDRVMYELAWAYRATKQADSALAQFTRIADHHANSALAAEANYHLGEDRYQKGNYQEAANFYRRSQEQTRPGAAADLREKAAYKLAWCHYQVKEFDRAREMFRQQIAAYPAGALAVESQFMQGECLFQQGKFAEALQIYEKVRDAKADRADIWVVTHLHGGQCLGQLKRWDECIKWLAPILEKESKSVYAPLARYEIGWAYHQLDRFDDALRQYRVVSDGTRNEVGARARFMSGEIHFARKEYEQAIAEFRRVMFGYGGNQSSANVKIWQARAGFEAGQCAAVMARSTSSPQDQQRWRGEARKFFQYVRQQHPQAEEAKSAADQLKRLGA